VVLEDGTQLGVLSRDDALKEAEDRGLDLVEIAPRSKPPVCRIMDYGRFKYQESKKAKAAKKHASTMELKEIKFRPKIAEHDFDFKVKNVRKFLEQGNKCRLVCIFRGREVVHPRTGLAVLNKVVETVEDIGNVEVRPNLEGKRMTMIIGPRAGVIKRPPKRQAAKDEGKEAKPAAKPAAKADAKPDAEADAKPAAQADAKPAKAKEPAKAEAKKDAGGDAKEAASAT
jgi:translation initiation factor IF-3